jgi:SAM-dependent methyltransferase
VLRRALDLQAASIWNDLSVLLRKAKGDVLDVGCGAQPYRILLPENVEYRGLDIEEAQGRFGYEVPDVIRFDGTKWPITDRSIDLVLATETLEHVSDPNFFLREAKRCLKPGGTLILTIPFAARWHFIPFDYWRFTPSALSLMLSRVGFQNVEVFSRGNALTVACYKVLALFLPLFVIDRRRHLVAIIGALAGIVIMPLIIVLAIVGHLTLRDQGANDCLGYTVVARS